LRARRKTAAARKTAPTQTCAGESIDGVREFRRRRKRTGTTIATEASSAFFFFFLKRALLQAEHLQAFFALVPSADLALQFFFA